MIASDSVKRVTEDEIDRRLSDSKKRKVAEFGLKTPREARPAPSETPFSTKRVRRHLFATPGGVGSSAAEAVSGSPTTTPDVNSASMSPRRIRHAPRELPREPMKVYLRVRPISSDEAERKETNCIHLQGNGAISIRAPKDSLAFRATGAESETQFSFADVFDTSASQQDVFRGTALPLVEDFLQGGNGLLFAYGITNAGKTYTISGTKSQQGILPRMLDVVFNSIAHCARLTAPAAGPIESVDDVAGRVPDMTVLPVDSNFKYGVWLSYLEIYNERIFDLLDDIPVEKRESLKLKEDRAGHVFVKGLKETAVATSEDGFAILQKASKNRQMATTLLNQDSSRSHSVVVIKLVQVPKDKDQNDIKKDPSVIKYSKLSVIDLAGSERNSRTKTTGGRLKEAAHINTSLMTFGRCLEALRYNQAHVHLPPKMPPFRDSKLTRLFQDYFIGNGKALMIVNVSPCSTDYDETCNVLKFSATAREVTIRSEPSERSKLKVADDADKALALLGPCAAAVAVSQPATEMPINAASAVLADPSWQRQQLQQLQTQHEFHVRQLESRFEAELQLADEQRQKLEATIRDEVAADFEQRVHEIEENFKQRMQNEMMLLEVKYERKLKIAGLMHEQHAHADNAEQNELRRQVKRLEDELGQYVISSGELEHKLKAATAVQSTSGAARQLEQLQQAQAYNRLLEQERIALKHSLSTAEAQLGQERKEKAELKARVAELISLRAFNSSTEHQQLLAASNSSSKPVANLTRPAHPSPSPSSSSPTSASVSVLAAASSAAAASASVASAAAAASPAAPSSAPRACQQQQQADKLPNNNSGSSSSSGGCWQQAAEAAEAAEDSAAADNGEQQQQQQQLLLAATAAAPTSSLLRKYNRRLAAKAAGGGAEQQQQQLDDKENTAAEAPTKKRAARKLYNPVINLESSVEPEDEPMRKTGSTRRLRGRN
eukprot:TRINITY_DN3605_c0_g1_i2.p1 TRINITY_DN3605_c0_g1~~TRINITY_DN3605_c0_g1_i2.p1  ORF type:complete len:995 (-),score=287.46 TRINITY_DN3605_c0_g1_i2:249-3095(-)